MSDASHVWAKVMAKARKCIVQIRILTVQEFDGNESGPSIGTGFVIDKKLGVLLTNRHVVSTAPIQAEAVFMNEEQVAVQPLYIDPIHDFGFFKFDPKKVKYMDFEELSLKPTGAKKGVEIIVVGSDAGEKTMILRGTISRTDRNPPEYEPGSGFADHNTFYITAACDTSGGSSGSPVLDITGSVVALNAGASVEAASSFFLPLDRAIQALAVIRTCLIAKKTPIQKYIKRGTLQCVFGYVPMSECKRLGINDEEELILRKSLPKNTDLLVADSPVPRGPADNAGLMSGDVLYKIQGKHVNQFLELEAILDNNVNLSVEIEIKRGEKRIQTFVHVTDAYEMYPNEFLQVSNAIIHPIGFSTANDFLFPMGSLVLERAGFAFERGGMSDGTVLCTIDNEPIQGLKHLEELLSKKRDGETCVIKQVHLYQKFPANQQSILNIDRKWFPMQRCERDANDFGTWVYHESPPPPAPASSETTARIASSSRLSEDQLKRPASFRLLQANNYSKAQETVFRSLVTVYFHVPHAINGTANAHYLGTGYICSKELGLVVTDRNTVVHCLGDCHIDIAFTYGLKARVVYLHPFHNVAIVQYDVTELGSTEVQSLELFDSTAGEEGTPDLKRGQELEFFGFSLQNRLLHLPKQKVVGIERATVGTSISSPRFAAKDFDQVKFEKPMPVESLGGVFVDENGVARAILTSFSIQESESEVYLSMLTTPIARAVKQVIEHLTMEASGLTPPPLVLYSLSCEFGIVPLSSAISGWRLPTNWAKVVQDAADEDTSGAAGFGSREVLSVHALMAGQPPSKMLRTGDLLLLANGTPIVSYSVLDKICNECGRAGKPIRLALLRDFKIMDMRVTLAKISCLGTRHVVNFCGIQCQQTHDAARMHSFVPAFMTKTENGGEGRPGVYVSGVTRGSPATKGGMVPVRWIIEINEFPIQDLQDLLAVVRKFRHGQPIRIRSIGWQGAEAITIHELDLHHCKTFELVFDETLREWTRSEVAHDL